VTRVSMSHSLTASPRSQATAPPSSFPGGLQPTRNASRNELVGNRGDSNTRRTSRIDMSFEQALEAGGTVVIKEGIDFDSLGGDLTPSLKFLSSGGDGAAAPSPLSPPHSPSPPTSTRRQSMIQQAATSNIKSSLASSTSRPTASTSVSTSASSSSNDLFYDAEDPDYQTKRRSMYRSQGTASSPDLATLVRKAKQRATILPSQFVGSKDRHLEPTPPLPAGPHAPSDSSSRPRHRGSTCSSGRTVPSTITPSSMPKGKLQKFRPTAGPSGSADSVPTSAGRDDGSIKASVEVYFAFGGADSNLEFKVFG
jgi:PH/SEC7 domain-containing protein